MVKMSLKSSIVTILYRLDYITKQRRGLPCREAWEKCRSGWWRAPVRCRSDSRRIWSRDTRTPERLADRLRARRCDDASSAAGLARTRSSPVAAVGRRPDTRSGMMALTCRPPRRAARGRPERPTGHTSRAQPAAAAMSHERTNKRQAGHSHGHGARRQSLRATDNFDSVTTAVTRYTCLIVSLRRVNTIIYPIPRQQ